MIEEELIKVLIGVVCFILGMLWGVFLSTTNTST